MNDIEGEEREMNGHLSPREYLTRSSPLYLPQWFFDPSVAARSRHPPEQTVGREREGKHERIHPTILLGCRDGERRRKEGRKEGRSIWDVCTHTHALAVTER